MPPFIIFKALVITVIDSLTFALHSKQSVFGAPFTLTKAHTVLLSIFEDEGTCCCYFDKDCLVNEGIVLQSHHSADIGLQRFVTRA